MSEQQILTAEDNYRELDEYLRNSGHKKILLVCGNSIQYLQIGKYLEGVEDRLGIKVIRFSGFKPNPTYESAVSGTEFFCRENCDAILAVGGGSAMDVAKCIKLFSNMDHSRNYLEQKIVPNEIDFMAVPTTAGTGSEATRFAVIYHQGEKQSISDESCIPSTVLIDPSVLKSLPEYHRKASMLDALCHALESFWSVNSTEESQRFSAEAVKLLLESKEEYLENKDSGNAKMLKAANLAGKAINITQTTAGHAMCYKLTSLYGLAHGHAAALCVSELFPYMIANIEKCTDPRGKEYLQTVFKKIAKAMGCTDADAAARKYNKILADLSMEAPQPKEEDYDILKISVNPERLKNNPIELDIESIDYLYHRILQK